MTTNLSNRDEHDMKAVRVHEYGDPDVLVVEDVPVPTPGADQLLIKVRACGINPLDAWFRSGHLAARFARPMPYTPGVDVVGTVAQCGADVTSFKAGDLVMGILSPLADGGYAQYVVADAGRFVALPEGIDPIQAAAAMTPGVTGMQLLDKAMSIRTCRHVLLLGALGAVGRAALARAIEKGVQVTAVVLRGDENEAKKLGAEYVLTADSTPPADIAGKFDCILDTVGPHAVVLWEQSLAAGGAVISVVPLPASLSRTDIQMVPLAYSPDQQSLTQVAKLMQAANFGDRIVETLSLHETGKAHAVLLSAGGGRKFVVVPND